jgi:DNA-binding NtrC family response regulator
MSKTGEFIYQFILKIRGVFQTVPIGQPGECGFMNQEDKYSNLAVLVVDDEARIIQAYSRHLKRWGYTAVTSNDPLQALEIIRERDPVFLEGKDIAVLLTDQDMPGLKGKQLIEMAKPYCPDMVCVLMSGGADFTDNKGKADYFIPKPVPPEELHRLLRTALEQYCHESGQSHDRVSDVGIVPPNPSE